MKLEQYHECGAVVFIPNFWANVIEGSDEVHIVYDRFKLKIGMISV